ncbi:MAG: DUF4192 domain-containing protein [Actinobacteria bacterium]|nr:DUF4192 domain-containing protein [Actinomycetota bacterium]
MIVSSPRQLLSALPHLIGFHPDNSIVTVAMDDDEILTIARVDSTTASIQLPASVLATLRQAKKPSTVLVAYRDDPITLDQLTELVPSAKEFQLLDALWVRNGRWSSLMCDDLGCCPVEGNELADVTATDLEFVVAGSAPFSSREDLANRLESINLDAKSITVRDQANQKVYREFDKERQKHESKVPARSDYLERLMKLWTTDAKCDWQSHALLVLVVTDIQMRDGFLRQMLDNTNLRLPIRTSLMSAISQAHEEHVAALATALAGCAWLDGNGALATVALDRALEADASYSLARLLERAISHNVPPSVWTESLEAVSYEECLAGAA